jgi:hypothetical protein
LTYEDDRIPDVATYDERTLRQLTVESQDLQSDALKATRDGLDEFVAVSREQSTTDPALRAADAEGHAFTSKAAAGALVAGGFGVAVATLLQSGVASAATNNDIPILQTAASIEVLAVATYTKALTLPYIGGSSANAVVKAFVTETRSQHSAHLAAFNAAVKSLGGKEQNNPDPKYDKVVAAAVPKLTTAADVVTLAKTLELVAAETYVNDCSTLSSTSARKVMASIMGVEAQHVAVLDAVGALLAAGAPQLIALSPTNVTKLPAAAGSVGIPYPFWPTSEASPASEGAVK